MDQIAAEMRALTFKRGDRVVELATEWNLSESTVRNYTTEAWRRVVSEVTNPEATKEHVCIRLHRAVDEAFEARDFKGLAQLANVYTMIVGAQAPKRIDAVVIGINTADPRALAERHEAIARALRAQSEDDEHAH